MEEALYWLVGVVGVPLVNFLKSRLGWEGVQALWLTVAVSAVLGVGALLLSRELDWIDFVNPQSFFAALGSILAAATLAYKLLVGVKRGV